MYPSRIRYNHSSISSFEVYLYDEIHYLKKWSLMINNYGLITEYLIKYDRSVEKITEEDFTSIWK